MHEGCRSAARFYCVRERRRRRPKSSPLPSAGQSSEEIQLYFVPSLASRFFFLLALCECESTQVLHWYGSYDFHSMHLEISQKASFPSRSLRSVRSSFFFLIPVVFQLGTNLLKHTRYGYPHLRQFQLSMDRRRLLWYTSSKSKSSSVVHLPLLQGLLLGQKSQTFQSYRLPALQHLSFSLVFYTSSASAVPPPPASPSVSSLENRRGLPPEGEKEDDDEEEEEDGDGEEETLEEDREERRIRKLIELSKPPTNGVRTLDLTCKDEFEYDMWVTGLKAIIAANKGVRISKKLLLSHSRRFR